MVLGIGSGEEKTLEKKIEGLKGKRITEVTYLPYDSSAPGLQVMELKFEDGSSLSIRHEKERKPSDNGFNTEYYLSVYIDSQRAYRVTCALK